MIVVNLRNVPIGGQCPVVFKGTQAQCVDWISQQPDADDGFYQIDIDFYEQKEEQQNRSKEEVS